MAIFELTGQSNQEQLDACSAVVETAHFRVALTGAGISLASGLPNANAAVHSIALRDVFRPEALEQNPNAYFQAFRHMVYHWRSAIPNHAHTALAQAGVWVVTQNIDGLHRDAGSRHVIELHGNLRELRCPSCQTIYTSELALRHHVPTCPACCEVLRPGYSFEGGEIRHFSRAVDWVGRAQVVLVIGTALEMYPVRELPAITTRAGGSVIHVNDCAEQLVPLLLRTVT